MKRFSLLLVLPLLAACSGLTDEVAGPSPNNLASPAQFAVSQDMRDRYIVAFRSDAPVSAVMTDNDVARGGGKVHFRYSRVLRGFAATLPPQAVAALQRNPNVDFIVPDGIATITGSGSDSPVASWGLDRIDQRDRPLNNTYDWTHDGAGVHAYILDTGIRTSHSTFGGRASPGFDAIGDGQNGADCNGHGTHVAGTVGGSQYGVAKAVELVAVRVLNCSGSGTWGQVIAGIDWVAVNAIHPAVANMSLGGGASEAVDAAVANAIASGVTFALAAGNSSVSACNSSPARTPPAITVGSTTSTDARSSFSNFGTCVDIFAPGSSITSSWWTSNTATNTISGTSMASPHVAGVAALYLQANPLATPAAVAAALVNNASSNKVSNPGTGSPNKLLYSLVNGGTPPANDQPVAAFSHSCTNLSCTFTNQSTDDGTFTSAWAFGDGNNSTQTSPDHTYAAAGSYTVQLTVTDDDGASNSTSKLVTVTGGGGGGLTLTASGFKRRGVHNANLTWSPTNPAQQVQVKRNGTVVATTTHDGSHSLSLGGKGSATYQLQVCVVGGVCSNIVSLTF